MRSFKVATEKKRFRHRWQNIAPRSIGFAALAIIRDREKTPPRNKKAKPGRSPGLDLMI
jgi:hypothetical protein